jgi:hypothetical protein
MTARILTAIVFLLIPTLAPAQTSQTQGKTDLGSGLIDHSQKMTVAAMQIAEK